VANDDLNIHVRLTGARAAGAEAKGLRAEIVGVGKATGGAATASGRWNRASAETEKRAGSQGKLFKGLRGAVGGLGKSYFGAAKGVLAAGAAFASFEGIKSAVNTTAELGKTTIGLSKNLGLSTEAASEWAAVAKTRGVDAKALNMSFGTLSKNIDASSKAGSSQAKTFEQLGVPLQVLRKGNFQDVLGAVSDRLNKMGPGAERTALSMRLFGRGWQTIVPVLRDGSKGMQEQLDLAKKYGATFGGKTVKSVQDLISAQREAKFATLGLQIAIGTTLTPILTKVIGKFSQFVLQMRQGKGAGGELRHALEQIWHAAKPVVVWFGRAAINIAKFAGKHPGLVKVAAALFLASKALKLMRFASAIRGAALLWGAFNKIVASKFGARIAKEVVSNVGGIPGKLAGFRSRFALIGKLAGAAYVASFIAQLLNLPKEADPLLILHPPSAGDPRPGHGDIVSHHKKVGKPYRVKGHTYQNYLNMSTGTQTAERVNKPMMRLPPRTPRVALATPGAQIPTPAATTDPTVIHNVLQVDGKTIWESWDKHDRNQRARR
jgi:hypothetical protein